MRSKTLRKV